MCGSKIFLALIRLRATRALDKFLKSPENFSDTKEGLNGVNRQPSNGPKINRQPSKMEYFYRQMSEQKLAVKFVRYSLTIETDWLKWG